MDLLFSGIVHRRFWDRTLYARESVATRLHDHRFFFCRLSAGTLSNQDEDSPQELDRLILRVSLILHKKIRFFCYLLFDLPYI